MEDVKWMMELKTIIHFLFKHIRHHLEQDR